MGNNKDKAAEESKDGGTQAIFDKADQVEVALTEEEQNRDFTKMHALDLGENENYKTRLVQKRWA